MGFVEISYETAKRAAMCCIGGNNCDPSCEGCPLIDETDCIEVAMYNLVNIVEEYKKREDDGK